MPPCGSRFHWSPASCPTTLVVLGGECSLFFAPRGGGWLTADVEQVCEEEGLLVEVLYGEDDGSIQAAPEGLLGAALVRDERLKHGTDHVQLGKKGTEGQVAFHTQGQVAVPSYLPVLPSALKENCLKEAPITAEKWTWSYGNLPLSAVLEPSTCQASIHHWACHLPL